MTWTEVGIKESLDIGETTKIWTEIHYSSEGEFDTDEFFKYWMDEVDPRGSKRLSLEHFMLDGGGDY